jgi:hypothetical protein
MRWKFPVSGRIVTDFENLQTWFLTRRHTERFSGFSKFARARRTDPEYRK